MFLRRRRHLQGGGPFRLARHVPTVPRRLHPAVHALRRVVLHARLLPENGRGGRRRQDALQGLRRLRPGRGPRREGQLRQQPR